MQHRELYFVHASFDQGIEIPRWLENNYPIQIKIHFDEKQLA